MILLVPSQFLDFELVEIFDIHELFTQVYTQCNLHLLIPYVHFYWTLIVVVVQPHIHIPCNYVFIYFKSSCGMIMEKITTLSMENINLLSIQSQSKLSEEKYKVYVPLVIINNVAKLGLN